jgi:hypothetical protein
MRDLSDSHTIHPMTLCSCSIADLDGGFRTFAAAEPNGGFGTEISLAGCLPALQSSEIFDGR